MKLTNTPAGLVIEYNQLNKSLLENLIAFSKKGLSEEVESSSLKIGLEFEFYIGQGDDKSHRDSFDYLVKHQFSNIIEKLVFIKEGCEKQKDTSLWYLERDDTLERYKDFGYELVSPMLGIDEAIFYINAVNNLIDKFGFTTEECGFHVHISSQFLGRIDPSVMCLTSNGVFDDWKSRGSFNKDIHSKFNLVGCDLFDDSFHDLSKNMTISSRCEDLTSDNHLEIRAMGGDGYQKKSQKIVSNLLLFIEQSFIKSCNYDYCTSKEMLELKEQHSVGIKNELKNILTFSDIKNGIDIMFHDFDSHLDRVNTTVLILNEYDKREDKFVPFGKLLQETVGYLKSKDRDVGYSLK